MAKTLTAKHEVRIEAPPDAVFDFTQDWSRRASWDRSIREASVTSETPRRVAVRAAGGLDAVFEYRVFDRPRRTSVAMTDVRSRLVAGGGGAWHYEPDGSGTRWTATNSVTLRDGLLARLLAGAIERKMRRALEQSMGEAKARIEAGERIPYSGV